MLRVLLLAAISLVSARGVLAAEFVAAEATVETPMGVVDELLERARTEMADLEPARALPLTEQVLARAGITHEQRVEAYRLQAYALVVMGRTIDAESPFRLLLRVDPTFDLSTNTAPKILAVFRKVQVEEQRLAEQYRELERQRIVQSLELNPRNPADPVGGVALEFGYELTDPESAVEQIRLNYRRRGEPEFASVPLERTADNLWSGAIPGEWTVNDEGLDLEYFVATFRRDRMALLALGSAEAPLAMSVAPGELVGDPWYESVWFWSIVGGVVVAGSVTAGVLIHDSRSVDSHGVAEPFRVDN
jgi:hypothetical protein